MASEVHVNDVGTKFLATIKDDGVVVDISTATSITMILNQTMSLCKSLEL